MDEERVRVLDFYSILRDGIFWEISDIPRHYYICATYDCRGQYMPIIGIR